MINRKLLPDKLLLFFEKIIKKAIAERMKRNVSTLKKREQIVEDISTFLHSKFDLSDTQIFIFGSFLRDDFIPGSDIDIGIYSEDESKEWEIYADLDIYLNEIRLKHDLIKMELNEKMLINIPIIIYGKTLTEYESEDMFKYISDMVQKHGTGPYNLYI